MSLPAFVVMRRTLALGLASAAIMAAAACSSSADSTDDGGRAAAQADAAQRKANAVSVRVVEARRRTIQPWIFAEGTARSVRREYLSFQNAGRVDWVKPGLRPGDTVRKGQLLARQDQRRPKADLVKAQTQLTVERSKLSQDRTEAALQEKTFQRYAVLLEKKSASQQEYDEAKAKMEKAQAAVATARAQIDSAQAQISQNRVALEESELHSPIDGVVARLNIDAGIYFDPSVVRTDSESSALQTVPIMVIDPDNFEIRAALPAGQREQVEAGHETLIRPGGASAQPALAKNRRTARGPRTREPDLQAYPVTGDVFSVTPSIDPGSRSIEAKIHAHDEAGVLQDGMFVAARIAAPERTDVVSVPYEAVLYRDNQALVFVYDTAQGVVHERDITLGVTGEKYREVVDGLEAGDKVVTDGRNQLSEGAAVRVLRNAEPGA